MVQTNQKSHKGKKADPEQLNTKGRRTRPHRTQRLQKDTFCGVAIAVPYGVGWGLGLEGYFHRVSIGQALTLDIIRRKNYPRLGCVVHAGLRGFAQPAK